MYRAVSSILTVLRSVSSAVLFPLSFLIFVVSSLSLSRFWSVLLKLKKIFFSLETSSLAQGLFRNVLFNFQVFGDFFITFLSFTSDFIMIREYILHVSNPFVKVCFVTKNMILVNVPHVHLKE